MTFEYDGKYNIVWNERDIEMDLYADLDSDGEIADVNISNAHYIDNDEPIEAEEIEKKVYDNLCNEEPSFWGIPDSEEDRYSGEMDCVDYWRYLHEELGK